MICLLLPQLSKLKVGGLEAELEKTTLEPSHRYLPPLIEYPSSLNTITFPHLEQWVGSNAGGFSSFSIFDNNQTVM